MKNKSKSVELFLALGLVTAIGISSNSPVNAKDINELTGHSHLLAQGGEGGEGGEGGATKLSPGEQANAIFQDKLSGTELLSALQKGGYVIYFRHAQTTKDYADQVNAVMGDCSTQRMLSEEGKQQAKDIGAAFQSNSIPVSEIITSEYCRAWQTAELAFGKYEQNPALNFPPAEEYTEEQIAQMKANLMPLLTAVPESGTNTVIVGHDDVFEAATGIYPDPQGMAYVVKPNGNGGFELVANLLPIEWSQLNQ